MGVTDRLSFGSGKEVMPYLKEGSETMLSVDLALTEAGNMGHIVPGHFYMLKMASCYLHAIMCNFAFLYVFFYMTFACVVLVSVYKHNLI